MTFHGVGVDFFCNYTLLPYPLTSLKASGFLFLLMTLLSLVYHCNLPREISVEYYGPCAGYFLFITIFKTSLAPQKNQDSFAEKLRLQDVENHSGTEPARHT